MLSTSIFPNLDRLYPGLKIITISEAWKFGFGWSVNIYRSMGVISQIRLFKEQGFTKVSLVLQDERNHTNFKTDWNIQDLQVFSYVFDNQN
jgi:hypothetical protein